MQLSVVSALARVDVDPWEEAARLAMPKTLAEKTLVSTLNKVSALSRDASEAKAVAARLIQLVPQHDGGDGSSLTIPARAT
jgi:hypothetical protein